MVLGHVGTPGHLRNIFMELQLRSGGKSSDLLKVGSNISDFQGLLVWRGIFDDLGAQVGAMDGAQILLVGLAIGCILERNQRNQ